MSQCKTLGCNTFLRHGQEDFCDLCAEQHSKGSAFSQQIDGSHYKKLKVQPIEFCEANRFRPIQTFIIKHASRVYDKGETITDFDKIIHYAQLGKELWLREQQEQEPI